jgi:hypothetical protein
MAAKVKAVKAKTVKANAPVKWTKDKMKEALETKYTPATFLKVIKVIYDRQTADEKAAGETKVSNGMGFSGRDAGYASSVYERAIKRPEPTLTPKEHSAMLRIMKHYAGQLCLVANSRNGSTEQVDR